MMQANKYFVYKIRHTVHKVHVSDIVCIESNRRIMIVHLADGRKEEFYGRLRDIYESDLTNCGFIYIHKQFVVNSHYIARFKYRQITLDDGTTLPVSQKRYRAVKAQYSSFLEAC